MIHEQGLPAVVTGLRRARSGIRGRLLLRDTFIGLASVAGTTAAWRLVAAVVPAARVWTGPHAWSTAAATGAAAAVAVVLASVVWIHVRRATPSVLDLARRADRRFSLQERLSTALEVAAPGREPSGSVLQVLLVADAAAVGDRVEPSALVHVPLAGHAGRLFLALLVAAAVQLVPLRAPAAATGATQGTGSHAASQAAPLPTVTDVKRAAALVRQDAFVRGDPKLEAVAAALQDLGARMAQGQIGTAQLAQEVGRLRVQLQQAYEGGAAASGAKMVSPQKPASQQAGSAASKAAQAGQPGGPSKGPAVKVAGKGSSSSLSDLVQQLEAGAPNRRPSTSPAARSLDKMGSTPGGGLSASQSQSYSYSRNNPAQNALFAQQNALLDRPGQAGGQPAGAARHATKGLGDAAGHGAQPLSDGAASPTAAGKAGAKVVLPSSQLLQGGQRIQLDAAPNAKRTQVVDVAPGTAVAGAPPSETALPAGPILDGVVRDVLERYFLPSPAAGSGASAAAKGAAP